MFIFAPNVNLGDQRQAPPLSENLGYYANVPPQAPQASHHHLSYSFPDHLQHLHIHQRIQHILHVQQRQQHQ